MERDFIVIHKSSFLTKVIASISILLYMFVQHPEFFDINEVKMCWGPDANLYYYLVKYIIGHFFENPFFQTTMHYPYGYTLAWSDNFILPSLIVKFFNFFFSFNVSLNLCYLLARFLNGFSVFLILYLLTGSRLFSILPAMLFTYNISFFMSLSWHPQLQFFFFIPLSFYYFLKFLAYKRKLDAFFIGFLICLSFLTAAYYTVYVFLLLFFSFIALLILKPKYINFDFISKLGIGGLLGVLPTVPFVLPYLKVKVEYGTRDLYSAYVLAANLFSYIATTGGSKLYRSLNFNIFSHGEAGLFPGVIILLSFFVCLYALIKNISFLRRYLIIFLSCLTISGLFSIMGSKAPLDLKSFSNFIPFLSFLDKLEYLDYMVSFYLWCAFIALVCFMWKYASFEAKKNQNHFSCNSVAIMLFFLCFVFYFLTYGPLGAEGNLNTEPTSLYALLYAIFPGFSSLRATGRIGFMVVMFMFLLFAYNFFLFSKNNKKFKYIFIVLCFICGMEEIEIPLEAEKPYVEEILFQEELKKLPKDYAVFYLPLSKLVNEEINWHEIADYHTNYMIHSVDTGHKTVNGYSGYDCDDINSYHRRMLYFPDNESVKTLSSIYNLKYIVYDGNKRDGFNSANFENELEKFKNDLKILKKDGNKYLIEYIGAFENRDDYFIKVPKYLSSIKLAIKTENSSKNGEGNSITIINNNNNAYVGKITPIEDGVWHEYEISLTNEIEKNKITPYRLSFRGGQQQKIVLKSYQHL